MNGRQTVANASLWGMTTDQASNEATVSYFAERDRRTVIRHVLAGAGVLVGAAALVLSVLANWTQDRKGTEISVSELWRGLDDETSNAAASLLVPLVIAAMVGLVGFIVRRRLVVGVSAFVGLATTSLFLIQYSRLDNGIDRFHRGFTNAVAGTALLLIAIALLPTSRAPAEPPASSDQPEYE